MPSEPEKEPLVSVKEVKQDLRKTEPPLVDLKVSNPVTYIKSWWKRIIGNEGMELTFRIRPLTAIAIAVIALTITLGIGRFELPFTIPYFVYSNKVTPPPADRPSPTNLYRNTGFVGELRYNKTLERYYLITGGSETVNLTVPENIDLTDLIGRRIFAAGVYYLEERSLTVLSAEDLEVLPEEIEPVPTNPPAGGSPPPTPSPSPTSSPATSPSASPS